MSFNECPNDEFFTGQPDTVVLEDLSDGIESSLTKHVSIGRSRNGKALGMLTPFEGGKA